jgi:hypothetical protein
MANGGRLAGSRRGVLRLVVLAAAAMVRFPRRNGGRGRPQGRSGKVGEEVELRKEPNKMGDDDDLSPEEIAAKAVNALIGEVESGRFLRNRDLACCTEPCVLQIDFSLL